MASKIILLNSGKDKQIASTKSKTILQRFINENLKGNFSSNKFKFRVFDRRTKSFISDPDAIVISSDGIKLKEGGAERYSTNDLVIQFCTGEKDMYGNLIYQGDILRTDESGWVATIMDWGGYGFGGEDHHGGFAGRLGWSRCEILGNVCELFPLGKIRFAEAAARELVREDDIDEYIALWEKGKREQPLHEFLGLTKRQLKSYQKRGMKSLERIIGNLQKARMTDEENTKKQK